MTLWNSKSPGDLPNPIPTTTPQPPAPSSSTCSSSSPPVLPPPPSFPSQPIDSVEIVETATVGVSDKEQPPQRKQKEESRSKFKSKKRNGNSDPSSDSSCSSRSSSSGYSSANINPNHFTTTTSTTYPRDLVVGACGSDSCLQKRSSSLSQQLVDSLECEKQSSSCNHHHGNTVENLVGEFLPVVMDNRSSGGGRMMNASSWAQRMHRRAATLGTVVTSCGHPSAPYPRRIEKVKFGVPLDEVCKNDIPGPLLVLILKLNKEAPYKKDVFRAPGHQGNMKKLIHFLQNGRLVNIDNFSVYTIASVLKKFLRKLPDGIFGREGEQHLFQIIEMSSTEQQRDRIHSLISTLPVCTQRLIVLLFGTFRVIASNSERSQTGMTSEALGVSVAPSFFQSCVSDGKQAKMEDVMRFKVATKIMKFLIDNFGVSNLFGRENYEFYARITGRILKVEEDWIFSFRYPPDALVSREESLEAEKTWLQFESERWGLSFNLEAMSHQEECHSTPALIQASDRLGDGGDPGDPSSSLSSIPENNLLESYTRLSISLEDNGLFKVTEVHERQAARMKTRSEWFLSPSTCPKLPAVEVDEMSNPYLILREDTSAGTGNPCIGGGVLSSSNESVKQHPPIRRTSSKEKDRRLVRRGSSKKNKENGNNSSGAGVAVSGGACGGNPAESGAVGGSNVTVNAVSPSGLSPSGDSRASGNTPSKRSISSAHIELDCASGNGGCSSVGAAAAPTQCEEEFDGGACGGFLGAGASAAVTASSTTPAKNSSSSSSSRRSNSNGVGVLALDGTPSSDPRPSGAAAQVSELDCTETDVQTFHVTLTYKPRI